MKNRIALETVKDVSDFVAITSKLQGRITVTDNDGHTVNAKSLLGMVYAMEFDELWVESDHDIYFEIRNFVRENSIKS